MDTAPHPSRDVAVLVRPTNCYWVGIGTIVYIITAVGLIICVHLNFFDFLSRSQLLRMHIACGAFGALGAAMAVARKYYRVLITESEARQSGSPWRPAQWDLGWVFYYLTRPILGGVLGALTFTLSFVGVHVLATAREVEISLEGKFLLFALAFLSGFSVSRVLDRLDALAKQLFKPEGADDGD